MIHHIVRIMFMDMHRELSRDPAWWDYRIDFFQRYTLASLRAQTMQDFHLWIYSERGLEKFAEPLRQVCPDAAFTFGEHYPAPDLAADDFVYLTRIDSDDLYAPDALEIVGAQEPRVWPRDNKGSGVEALMFRRGYLHDVRDGRWGVYEKQSSPFHTLAFPADVFCDPAKFRQAFEPKHHLICGAYPWRKLPDFKFCVLLHGRNTGSTWENSCHWQLESFGHRQPNILQTLWEPTA